jgi:spore cortex formation protein SpoVR/YcgB (stage V sporulation)
MYYAPNFVFIVTKNYCFKALGTQETNQHWSIGFQRQMWKRGYVKGGVGNSWALVVHACNPSYSGGTDQEDHDLKPALGK